MLPSARRTTSLALAGAGIKGSEQASPPWASGGDSSQRNVANASWGVNDGRGRPGIQRSHETQFMTVGIRDVKVALAPFCIARSGLRREPQVQHTGIEAVDIRYAKYHSSPPRPAP